MGKFFAIILVVITLASAYPIVTHKFVQPEDISTHGHAIDEQLADTMAEEGSRLSAHSYCLRSSSGSSPAARTARRSRTCQAAQS